MSCYLVLRNVNFFILEIEVTEYSREQLRIILAFLQNCIFAYLQQFFRF